VFPPRTSTPRSLAERPQVARSDTLASDVGRQGASAPGAHAAEPPARGGLDLDQDLGFERRSGRIQRVGWATIAALIAAALLGLFGTGVLSRTVVTSGPLQLAYDRFGRVNAPGTMDVDLPGRVGVDGSVMLWLDRAFVDRTRIESVTPQPTLQTWGPDRLVFMFPAGASSERFRVNLRITPQHVGLVQSRLGSHDGSALRFWLFIYP
jgi:hypothetical protein